jgi:hypothetical protein
LGKPTQSLGDKSFLQHSLPSANRRSDRASQSYPWRYASCLHPLIWDQVGRLFAIRRILLQQ